MSAARSSLQRATTYLHDAEATDPNEQRAELEGHLATALVWARSVTLHLQADYDGVPGFEEWYALRQAEMRADPLMRYLLELRNVELHERPEPPRRVVHVQMTAYLRIGDEPAGADPPEGSSEITADHLFITDERFADRPAFELVREHLAKLEKIVLDAELAFGAPTRRI